jgi:hypothetical protein
LRIAWLERFRGRCGPEVVVLHRCPSEACMRAGVWLNLGHIARDPAGLRPAPGHQI